MVGQCLRIAVAGDDCGDDLHGGDTAGPGDVLRDMMQLQVHLHQRLLHVLGMRSSVQARTNVFVAHYTTAFA
jgi:hypothetical protein